VTVGSSSIDQDALRRVANVVVSQVQDILEWKEGAGPQKAFRKLLIDGENRILFDYLTERARTAYETRASFRKALDVPADVAHGILKGFMRHWAAGYVLVNYGEEAFEALPVVYP